MPVFSKQLIGGGNQVTKSADHKQWHTHCLETVAHVRAWVRTRSLSDIIVWWVIKVLWGCFKKYLEIVCEKMSFLGTFELVWAKLNSQNLWNKSLNFRSNRGWKSAYFRTSFSISISPRGKLLGWDLCHCDRSVRAKLIPKFERNRAANKVFRALSLSLGQVAFRRRVPRRMLDECLMYFRAF